MSKVYGQNPTAAISAVRRQDEQAGAFAQTDGQLSRRQEIAQIGQTLPLVFCKVENGVGGTWVAPKQIGIGFDFDYVHVAYVLSEGQISGTIPDTDAFLGQKPLEEVLDASLSLGYESLPEGSAVIKQAGRLPRIERVDFRAGSVEDITDPSIRNVQRAFITSMTQECTGMEIAITSNGAPWNLKIEALDMNDGYRLVKTVNHTFDSFSDTKGIFALPPSKYLFELTTTATFLGLRPLIVGMIEHYAAGDGVTPPPTFRDMTILGMQAVYSAAVKEENNYTLEQLFVFIQNGIEVTDVRFPLSPKASSNLYPNLVNYFLQDTIKLDDAIIDMASLRLIANMNNKYNLLFNGSINSTANFQQWLFRTSPYFWASPTQLNGKYGLAPVVPLNADGTVNTGTVQPRITIGLHEIVEGTYNMVMESSKERDDFVCVMVYRGSLSRTIGETKTVEVRYKGAALEGPYETHDITEFCVSAEHAIRAAMYILARRRYVTHVLNLTLTTQTVQFNPGDIVKADIEITGGTKNQYFYQVDSISEGVDGTVSLVLTHFPVNDQGQSLIALAMTQDLSEELLDQRSGQETSSSDFVWR